MVVVLSNPSLCTPTLLCTTPYSILINQLHSPLGYLPGTTGRTVSSYRDPETQHFRGL